MSTVDTKEDQEKTMTDIVKPNRTATRSAPRKAKGTSRQPGRPHKRLQNDVLSARTSVLHKKLQVLLAKRTLITERLEAYENETQLREQDKERKE